MDRPVLSALVSGKRGGASHEQSIVKEESPTALLGASGEAHLPSDHSNRHEEVEGTSRQQQQDLEAVSAAASQPLMADFGGSLVGTIAETQLSGAAKLLE